MLLLDNPFAIQGKAMEKDLGLEGILLYEHGKRPNPVSELDHNAALQ